MVLENDPNLATLKQRIQNLNRAASELGLNDPGHEVFSIDLIRLHAARGHRYYINSLNVTIKIRGLEAVSYYYKCPLWLTRLDEPAQGPYVVQAIDDYITQFLNEDPYGIMILDRAGYPAQAVAQTTA